MSRREEIEAALDAYVDADCAARRVRMPNKHPKVDAATEARRALLALVLPEGGEGAEVERLRAKLRVPRGPGGEMMGIHESTMYLLGAPRTAEQEHELEKRAMTGDQQAIVHVVSEARLTRTDRDRWRQLAEEHQHAAEGVADLYVEIQEAVAAAHGQLTDDGLIDDDYDAAEGVRLLCAERDRLADRVGEVVSVCNRANKMMCGEMIVYVSDIRAAVKDAAKGGEHG